MKRLIMFFLFLMLLSPFAYAITVNGAVYEPSAATTTITTTAATTVFTSANIKSHLNKTIFLKQVGDTSSYTVWVSPDNSSWYSYNTTTFANKANGTNTALAISGVFGNYWKVTGVLDAAGGISTPEVIFRAITI